MADDDTPKKGRRGSRKRAEQPALDPSLEPQKNTRVHPKAKAYVQARDERMLRTEDETDAHTALLEAMLMEGLEEYTYGGITVTVLNNRKCKVKVEGRNDEEG